MATGGPALGLMSGYALTPSAVLVAEDDNPHDANAVAIWVQGLKEGHLSRANARRYRPGLLGLQAPLWPAHRPERRHRRRRDPRRRPGTPAYSSVTTPPISACDTRRSLGHEQRGRRSSLYQIVHGSVHETRRTVEMGDIADPT